MRGFIRYRYVLRVLTLKSMAELSLRQRHDITVTTSLNEDNPEGPILSHQLKCRNPEETRRKRIPIQTPDKK